MSFGIIVTKTGGIIRPSTEEEAALMLKTLRAEGDMVASLTRTNPTNEDPISWEHRHGVEGASAEESEAELSRIAATMGRKGGASKSPAKAAAVRENGRKGGRPMKWWDLFIDNAAQGRDVQAATPASAARKLGLKDWYEDGRIAWWDEDGKHLEVIPDNLW